MVRTFLGLNDGFRGDVLLHWGEFHANGNTCHAIWSSKLLRMVVHLILHSLLLSLCAQCLSFSHHFCFIQWLNSCPFLISFNLCTHVGMVRVHEMTPIMTLGAYLWCQIQWPFDSNAISPKFFQKSVIF